VSWARRGTQPKIAEVPPIEARIRAIAVNRDLNLGDIGNLLERLTTLTFLKEIQASCFRGFKRGLLSCVNFLLL
jgi:hypothetical protein